MVSGRVGLHATAQVVVNLRPLAQRLHHMGLQQVPVPLLPLPQNPGQNLLRRSWDLCSRLPQAQSGAVRHLSGEGDCDVTVG